MSEEDRMDIGSLFRGSVTLTFLVEVVAAVMMLGSFVAYLVNMSGLIQIVTEEVAVLLLLAGSIVTLMFFLATFGFIIRINRRIGRAAVWDGAGNIDLSRPGAKTVVIIYGLAVGLMLILGMYLFYLVWKSYLGGLAATSLSVFGFSVSLAIFLLALLIQIVVVAVGRSAGTIISKVLAQDRTSSE